MADALQDELCTSVRLSRQATLAALPAGSGVVVVSGAGKRTDRNDYDRTIVSHRIEFDFIGSDCTVRDFNADDKTDSKAVASALVKGGRRILFLQDRKIVSITAHEPQRTTLCLVPKSWTVETLYRVPDAVARSDDDLLRGFARRGTFARKENNITAEMVLASQPPQKRVVNATFAMDLGGMCTSYKAVRDYVRNGEMHTDTTEVFMGWNTLGDVIVPSTREERVTITRTDKPGSILQSDELNMKFERFEPREPRDITLDLAHLMIPRGTVVADSLTSQRYVFNPDDERQIWSSGSATQPTK